MYKQRTLKVRWIIYFILVFSLIGLAETWAQKKEILVGANMSLSGALAMDALEARWAYEQAVADINEKGGIYVKEFGVKLPVKLIVVNDKSTSQSASEAVEELITVHKVDLLLSTFETNLVIPSCAVAERYKKYYHATTCLLPSWRSFEFKWSTLFFFEMEQFCSIPFEIWNTLPAYNRIKRPALLMEDTLDGQGIGNEFRRVMNKYGYQFVVDESWAAGAKDNSSLILNLKKNNVDAIIAFGTPHDCIVFVGQMKQMGFNVRYFYGNKGTWPSEFWDALGQDAQYILCDGFWSDSYPYLGAQKLGERFYKRFKRDSTSIGLFYALCQILWSAIEKAGCLDSAAVREAVLSHEFKDTVMGDVKYNPDGTAAFPSIATQWWNGRHMLVYPFNEGAWEARPAPPWEQR